MRKYRQDVLKKQSGTENVWHFYCIISLRAVECVKILIAGICNATKNFLGFDGRNPSKIHET